jgi:hypothetical protein
MKPRRTHLSNSVFRLPGGNEDNDLWIYIDHDDNGIPMIRSCWVPSKAEREAIAAGANVELIVWGGAHPPVAMDVVNYPLGAPPKD